MPQVIAPLRPRAGHSSPPRPPAPADVESRVLIVTQRPGLFGLSMAALRRLAAHVEEQAERFDGIVVVHDVEGIEQAAFLVDQVHRHAAPVVFVLADEAADADAGAGAEAAGRLRDAVTVAGAAASRGRGALVCSDGHIHAARSIHRPTRSGIGALFAPGSSPVGHVRGTEVHYGFAPIARDTLPLPGVRMERRRVEVVRTRPTSSGEVVDAAVTRGARGLVLDGVGAHQAAPSLVDAVARATADGVAVVVPGLARPWGAGPAVHGGLGGGAAGCGAPGGTLASAGAVPVRNASAAQAHVLLAVLLDRYPNRDILPLISAYRSGYFAAL